MWAELGRSTLPRTNPIAQAVLKEEDGKQGTRLKVIINSRGAQAATFISSTCKDDTIPVPEAPTQGCFPTAPQSTKPACQLPAGIPAPSKGALGCFPPDALIYETIFSARAVVHMLNKYIPPSLVIDTILHGKTVATHRPQCEIYTHGTENAKVLVSKKTKKSLMSAGKKMKLG